MLLPVKGSGHGWGGPRPIWHSPGSRARVAAPRSRSAALRVAATSTSRLQRRLPILCERAVPQSGCPAGLRRQPKTRPALQAAQTKARGAGVRGPSQGVARVAGATQTWHYPLGTGEVGEGGSAGLCQSPHPATIKQGSRPGCEEWSLGGESSVAPPLFAVQARLPKGQSREPSSSESDLRVSFPSLQGPHVALFSTGGSRSCLNSGSRRS